MWEETLLTSQDFREYCNKCDHQCSTYPTICREKAQAEKTWHARDTEIEEARKAGMREVTTWGDEECDDDSHYPSVIRMGIKLSGKPPHPLKKRECKACLQKQLKSWGLEG